jgi:hypothetical protein
METSLLELAKNYSAKVFTKKAVVSGEVELAAAFLNNTISNGQYKHALEAAGVLQKGKGSAYARAVTVIRDAAYLGKVEVVVK